MPDVVVLGGGVAGLTAAHELAERGFGVTVLERRHRGGGKARSIQVEPTRLGAHPYDAAHPAYTAPAWAPGEHGFRFFPGFYRHVIDTMARTPVSANKTVADGLVPTSRAGITQYGKPMFELPARFPNKPNDAFAVLQALLLAFSPVTDLTPGELAHFGARIWQILTSCPERRLAEYEKTRWWDFIGAEPRSPAYRKFLASGITRSLVAAKASLASTRTIGDIFVQLMLTVMEPLAGSTDRVFDGPTSHVWIDSWQQLLANFGACARWGVNVCAILFDGERVTGVVIEQAGHTEVVTGDYYVCALPIERAAPLISPALFGLGPALANLGPLSGNVEWMNGLQFYLRRPLPIVHGHVIHIDTEWALTSISQLQFWREGSLQPYEGEPDVKDILSVDISDWGTPGPNGRRARDCSREEVAREVWGQLKLSVEESGAGPLRDADLSSWFLDPDIQPGPGGHLVNVEPLLVNLADTWSLRPEAATGIPNLFLASDYVRTYTDLATMEAANEAARRAVNAILESSGYKGERCQLFPLEEPALLAPWRQKDLARFKLGLPWDATWADIAGTGLEMAAPGLAEVAALMKGVGPFVSTIEQVKLGVDLAQRAVGMSGAERAVTRTLEQLRAEVPWALQATSSLPVSSPSLITAGTAGSSARGGSVETPERAPADDRPAGFADRLEWYHERVAGALEAAVPDREPHPYMYGPMREFISRPAKGLRPALCLATCASHGGNIDEALASAAGIELLHNAFLVHDDIEDGSLHRRGGATMHRQVGEPLAINAGDALNAYAMRMFRSNLERLPPERALAVLDEVDHLIVETLEGQAVELGWERDGNSQIGVDDYLRMVLQKTAWYSFIHPMRVGAIVAGAKPDDDLDRFNRFGFLLGAAFQIQDDLLNLTGAARRYGKEIAGDLWEGKRTIILSHALSHAPPAERAQLEQFLSLSRQARLPRQVAAVYDVLEQSGALEWARGAAAALADSARDQFSVAFRDAQEGADLEFLRGFVGYLVERDL